MKISFYSIVLLLLIHSFVCQGQEGPSKHLFWISPTIGKTLFPTGSLAIGYESGTSRSVIISRYTHSAEIFESVQPGIKTKEFALMYGLKFGRLRASAGVSTVWGNNRGQLLYTEPDPLMGTGRVYEFVGYRTFGIPAELRYNFVGKYVGIGLTAFGNMNNKRSFVGLGASLYVGKLK